MNLECSVVTLYYGIYDYLSAFFGCGLAYKVFSLITVNKIMWIFYIDKPVTLASVLLPRVLVLVSFFVIVLLRKQLVHRYILQFFSGKSKFIYSVFGFAFRLWRVAQIKAQVNGKNFCL